MCSTFVQRSGEMPRLRLVGREDVHDEDPCDAHDNARDHRGIERLLECEHRYPRGQDDAECAPRRVGDAQRNALQRLREEREAEAVERQAADGRTELAEAVRQLHAERATAFKDDGGRQKEVVHGTPNPFDVP